MGLYDGFVVDNTTSMETSKFIIARTAEDLIQKVTVKSIELFSGSNGLACKVIVNKGEQECNGLIFNEVKEGATFYDGKENTVEMQNNKMKAVIAQLGNALVGDTFSLKPTKASFEGIIEGLNNSVKDTLGKKEIYVRLGINKSGFTTIPAKGGRIFADEASKLKAHADDIAVLNTKNNIKPDAESTTDVANLDF